MITKTLITDPFENDAKSILEWAYGPGALTMFKSGITYFGQRVGQSFMNTLRQYDLESYQRILGTLGDPFYDDKKLPAAIDLLTSK